MLHFCQCEIFRRSRGGGHGPSGPLVNTPVPVSHPASHVAVASRPTGSAAYIPISTYALQKTKSLPQRVVLVQNYTLWKAFCTRPILHFREILVVMLNL